MSALALQSFGFEGQTVRVMDQDGSPWFVAQDVCACLEIINHRNVVAALDEDEKGVHTVDTLGGAQQVSIVSESGLYALIFKSRKPAAVRFRKWVTSEVLPTLRTTGRYEVIPANDTRSALFDVDAREVARLELTLVREVRVLFGRSAAQDAWRRTSLPQPNVPPPRAVAINLPNYDPVFDRWWNERIEPVEGATTASSDLFADYETWCAAEEEDARTVAHFGRQLSQRGAWRRKTATGCIVRIGIALKV